MFRSTTINRELVLSLAKFILKYSVKYVVIFFVVVWQHVFERLVCCVHSTQHTSIVRYFPQFILFLEPRLWNSQNPSSPDELMPLY
jgi:hypothetical protein